MIKFTAIRVGDVTTISVREHFVLIDSSDEHLLHGRHLRVHKERRRFYCLVTINGTSVRLHRLLMPGHAIVDHRDGNGLNNRRINLRPCTNLQNCQNQHFARSKSGFKGVFFQKPKWRAQITKADRTISLGYYLTPEAAALAYDAKAIELFGEFACTNESLGLLLRGSSSATRCLNEEGERH